MLKLIFVTVSEVIYKIEFIKVKKSFKIRKHLKEIITYYSQDFVYMKYFISSFILKKIIKILPMIYII
jgi:hypothetical protein